jgi:hypothetical protein
VTDLRSLLVLGAITGLIAGAVSLSSDVHVPGVDEPAAVAAALIEPFQDYVEEEQLRHPPAHQVGDLALCLKAESSLDVEAVSRALAGTLVRVIPAGRCTSKTVKGDFGMFTAMTYWFDESGGEAASLEVEAVRCLTRSRCIVDINSFAAGRRYEVEAAGGVWTVTRSALRWIV